MPLVPREFKRSRADDLFDLLLRRRGRYPRRHHERHIARRLSQRFEHGAKALGELERERLLINGRDLPRVPSGDTVVRSTICGLTSEFSSVPKSVSYTR